MKNLMEPIFDDINIYNNIVRSKRSPRKETLNSIFEIIVNCYIEYNEAKNELELMSPFFISTNKEIQDLKSCLRHCYESPTAKLNALKKNILKIQSKESQGTCQLCGIDSPSTFDHYLPKESFPEFSILSKNLIPCCFECNNKKGNKWIENGKRLIMNLYFDQLVEVPFLKTRIEIEDQIPIMIFYIENAQLSPREIDLINTHFKTLNLFKRYKQQAHQIISFIISEITSFGLINRERSELKLHLRRHATAIKSNYGENMWTASIYEAVSENDECLDILCSEIV